MSSRARIALVLLILVTAGSLLLTGGWAWYLRSPAYRNSCATKLSAALGLPAEIGEVVPRSRRSREFRDVRVSLPERRGLAARCDSALLELKPTATDPNAYELTLRGGACEISTRTWLRADYRTVLESGLRPGFTAEGPQRVQFREMDLTFERASFRARLHNANGLVMFDDPNMGRAAIVCSDFNGHMTATPVTLRAEFSPRDASPTPTPHVQLSRVELVVPALPIASIGLADLVGIGLQTGDFQGRLTYRESDGRHELSVNGAVHGIALAECTEPLLGKRWRGHIPAAQLEELIVANRRPERLRFRGDVHDALVGDVLSLWNLGGVGGELTLHIEAAELSQRGIDRFVASGRCEGLALEQLTAALGWGRLTGRARVVIKDLTVLDNRLSALEGTVIVGASASEPHTIDRTLIATALRRILGIELPSFVPLPEELEYTQLGIRFELKDESLRLFGTHGPRDKTILTIAVAGHELAIVNEPEDPIDLTPFFDELRTRITAHIAAQLQRLGPANPWPGAPSSRPGTSPAPE
jgi:hypothetical protein